MHALYALNQNQLFSVHIQITVNSYICMYVLVCVCVCVYVHMHVYYFWACLHATVIFFAFCRIWWTGTWLYFQPSYGRRIRIHQLWRHSYGNWSANRYGYTSSCKVPEYQCNTQMFRLYVAGKYSCLIFFHYIVTST